MDASFKPVPALNGKSYMVSFQSANNPDKYITTAPDNNGVYLRQVDSSNSSKERASWLIQKINLI
jgi:Alpha-L-arabinofuranosidase B (ABFB) domain